MYIGCRYHPLLTSLDEPGESSPFPHYLPATTLFVLCGCHSTHEEPGSAVCDISKTQVLRDATPVLGESILRTWVLMSHICYRIDQAAYAIFWKVNLLIHGRDAVSLSDVPSVDDRSSECNRPSLPDLVRCEMNSIIARLRRGLTLDRVVCTYVLTHEYTYFLEDRPTFEQEYRKSAPFWKSTEIEFEAHGSLTLVG